MTDRDHINNLLGRYCRGVANFDRDEWGSTWAEDGRWTFLYAAAPLKVVGGSGAPVNPIAIR